MKTTKMTDHETSQQKQKPFEGTTTLPVDGSQSGTCDVSKKVYSMAK
jgi:hypothetical protein